MNKCIPIALLSFALGLRAAESASSFGVRAYGAIGDGRPLDTASIQQTIDACAAAGGGVVYFPTGRFLSGSLRLKSDVTLRLSPAAVLHGVTIANFRGIASRPEGQAYNFKNSKNVKP